MSLLAVADLRVSFETPAGPLVAVDGLSFALPAGRALGIVGESGSGKTQVALALLGLLAGNGRASGSARLDGAELIGMPRAALNRIRGARVGMVFQDPMTALNPQMKVGRQIAESLVQHRGLGWDAALGEAARLLDALHVPDAPRRLFQYPHEFSGGMRQRAMLAIALACRPDLLIADEPTTALDVTVQAQILRVLGELRRELNLAVLLITHDLAVVAELCDELLVMYAGREMESGPVDALLARPSHPYTRGLLRSRPSGAAGPLRPIAGQPPDPLQRAPGCPFEPRCPDARAACAAQAPASTAAGPARRACHVDAPELS